MNTNDYIIEDYAINDNNQLDIGWIRDASLEKYRERDERFLGIFEEAILDDEVGKATLDSARVSKLGSFFLNTLGWRKIYRFFQPDTSREITQLLLVNYLLDRSLYLEKEKTDIQTNLPLRDSVQPRLPPEAIYKILEEVKADSLHLRIVAHYEDQEMFHAKVKEKLNTHLENEETKRKELETLRIREQQMEELKPLFAPFLKIVEGYLGKEPYQKFKEEFERKCSEVVHNKALMTPAMMQGHIRESLTKMLSDLQTHEKARLQTAYLHWLDCVGCLKAFLYSLDPSVHPQMFIEQLADPSIFPSPIAAAGSPPAFVAKFANARATLMKRPGEDPNVLAKLDACLNRLQQDYEKARTRLDIPPAFSAFISSQDIENVFSDLYALAASSQATDQDLLKEVGKYEPFFKAVSDWLMKMPNDSPLLIASIEVSQIPGTLQYLNKMQIQLDQARIPEAVSEGPGKANKPVILLEVVDRPAGVVLPETVNNRGWEELLKQQTLPEYLFDSGLFLRQIYSSPNYEQFKTAVIQLLTKLQRDPEQRKVLEAQISNALEKIRPFVVSLESMQQPGRDVRVPFEVDSAARLIMKLLHDLPLIQQFLRGNLSLDQLSTSEDRMSNVTFPLSLFLKLTMEKEKFLPHIIPLMDDFYVNLMNACADPHKLPLIKKGLDQNLQAFDAPGIGTAIGAMMKLVGGLNFIGALGPIETGLKVIVKKLITLLNSERILGYMNTSIQDHTKEIAILQKNKSEALSRNKDPNSVEALEAFYTSLIKELQNELDELTSTKEKFQKLTAEVPDLFSILHHVIAGFLDNHRITPMVIALKQYRSFLYDLRDYIDKVPEIQKIRNPRNRIAAMRKAQFDIGLSYKEFKDQLNIALTGMLNEVSNNPLESQIFSLFATQLMASNLDPSEPNMTKQVWHKVAAPALASLFQSPELFTIGEPSLERKEGDIPVVPS